MTVYRPSDFDNVWEYVATVTSTSRTACKLVVYMLLVGGPIVEIMKENSLTINDVANIRDSFDHYVLSAGKREHGTKG